MIDTVYTDQYLQTEPRIMTLVDPHDPAERTTRMLQPSALLQAAPALP